MRVLISATMMRRAIDEKKLISRYILSDHKIEDYKYKFSESISDMINKNRNCDIKCNVTYRMSNVNSLCDIAKEHIKRVINGTVNKYTHIEINENFEYDRIKERSMIFFYMNLYY